MSIITCTYLLYDNDLHCCCCPPISVNSHSDTNLVCAFIQSGQSNSVSVLALDCKQRAKSGARWVHVSGF